MSLPRLAAGFVALASFVGLVALLPRAARGGRPLSEIEVERVLPALARSGQPALAPFREAAARILALEPSRSRPAMIAAGPPAVLTCAGRNEPLPAGFPEALARMADAADRLERTGDPSLLAKMTEGRAAEALRAAFLEAARAAAPAAGGEMYWVPRLGVLVSAEDGLRVVLAPEPVGDLVVRMHASRGSWDAAMELYQREKAVLSRGDPRGLFGMLQSRDAARRYDDAIRLAHLDLTLKAVLPNLIETIGADPGSLLAMVVDGTFPPDPLAVIAIRQDTAVNGVLGEDDLAFASTIAPLFVIVVASNGSAAITRLPVDRREAPQVAVLSASPDAGASLQGTGGDSSHSEGAERASPVQAP